MSVYKAFHYVWWWWWWWWWWWIILWHGWPTKGVYPYFQPGPLPGILTLVNLRHAASRVWACTEPEFRLSWIKLCSRDNHYTKVPHFYTNSLDWKKNIVLPHENHSQKGSDGSIFFCIYEGSIFFCIYPAFDFWNIYSSYMISIEDYLMRQLYFKKNHF